MPRNLVFFVNDDTWIEHNRTGIAAINDPGRNNSSHANSGRQKAIAEIAGINPGDRIFFRLGRSEGHPTRIMGLFRATSEPYFDPSPLFPGARYVRENLALRVEFVSETNYLNPVDMNHLWLSREQGSLWTIQQARGDVVGRHACISISDEEAEFIVRLLEANNPVHGPPADYPARRMSVGLTQIVKQSLPIDLTLSETVRTPRPGRLHYEAALQTLLMQELSAGRHRRVFGEFTEALPFVSTGAQTELDLLLVKKNEGQLNWYQVIELKAHTFSEPELQKVIDYEKWIVNTRCENVLQAHSVGIGYEFDDNVVQFVRGREKYGDRPIRLLKYRYHEDIGQIELVSV